MALLRFLSRTLLLAAALLPAHAEPLASLILVAKPGLADPNFRETVVLVTRTPEAQTVGVILNRPTEVKLADLWRTPAASGYTGALFFGGPVMRGTIIALWRSDKAPEAPAFEVLEHVYLSMHPKSIEALFGGAAPEYRLFAGFSGWGPRQLEGEIEREGWYVLPAREELLFRKDTEGLWRELVERATGARAGRGPRRDAVAILAQ